MILNFETNITMTSFLIRLRLIVNLLDFQMYTNLLTNISLF